MHPLSIMTLSENLQTERSSFFAPAECCFRRRLAAVLVAQALLTMSAAAPAAVLPADCASLGGTVGEGGVCSISGLELSSINDSWDISSDQTVVISGSDSSSWTNGISVGADNGGTFQINVADNASLTIRGGTNSSYGISVGAKDGTLLLVNAGSLLIKSGASDAHGIATGTQGGTFILNNGSSGVVRIEGGDSSHAYGMLSGVKDGLFTLSNAAGGRIEISGGGAESAYGIGSLARGETAKAVVENNGCILWQGSAKGAPGMVEFSSDGAETVVTNGSRGEMVIKGSDTANASGVSHWTYGAGSRVSIDNSGILSILGGAGGEGVPFAVVDGGSATVVNRGGAEMTIAGGSESYVSGIGTFSVQWGSEGTSTAEIINEAGAVLNISGGTAAGARGITYGTGSGGASFSILNQEDALLKLTGNTAQAIKYLNYSANSSAAIINSGTAVLNANAFYKFGEANADGSKNFTNKAAGTLRAEVGALFTGATVTKTEQTKTITVGMMTADGVKKSESRELTGYDYSVTGSAISMKSDWLNLAEFEEGSTVVFTDVPEGSEAAETIRTKFADAHGSGVNLAFAKPFAERGIDLASAQAMVDAHPGVVFYDSDIAVGGDIFKITGTTGFRSISGATGVTVTDGAMLTLIGDSRTASDSPLCVKEGGSLQLGTLVGDLGQSGGSLRSISNAGALTVLGGFAAKTLRNTGTASSDYGAIMELTGRGTEASDIGSYVNRGILRISGEAKSGRVKQDYGRFEVSAGASAHLDTLEGNGIVENKGTLVAEGGTLTGTVISEGLTSIEHYRGGLGSNFKAANGGVVMAESFNSLGVVRASGGTLVIGTAAKERYLLDHLDEARQIVEAGGSVSDAVLEALEAAGETQAVSTWRLRRATLTSDADMVTEDTIALLDDGDGMPVIPDEETVPVLEREPQIVLNKAVIQRESFAGAMTFAAHTVASEEASAAETLALNGRRGLSAELVGVTAKRGGYRAERTGVRIGMIGTDENVSFGWTGSVTNGDVKFEGSRSAQTISGTVFAGLKRHDVVLTGYAGAGFGRVKDGEDRPEYKSMMLGLQGGIPIQWEAWEILPHAGFRTIRLETDGADNATVKEVPVGLSVRGRFTVGDQTYLPAFDLTHVRTFGDRSVRTETQDAVIESSFTGKHRTELKLGVSAWTGRWRTELDCAGAYGEGGTRSASIGLRGTMSF